MGDLSRHPRWATEGWLCQLPMTGGGWLTWSGHSGERVGTRDPGSTLVDRGSACWWTGRRKDDEYGLTKEESLRQLEIQVDIWALRERIVAKHPDIYGGS